MLKLKFYSSMINKDKLHKKLIKLLKKKSIIDGWKKLDWYKNYINISYYTWIDKQDIDPQLYNFPRFSER